MEANNRVIALGFFDGVHLGHAALLRRVRERAEALGAIPAALTYDCSPHAMVRGTQIPLINTPEEREYLMESLYGIQEVEILHFDRALRELPWDRFVLEILRDRFHAVHVVAGHDFRFGYKGEGTPEKLTRICAELGIGCDIIGRVELDGITVSSTYIRERIGEGDLETANRFLGHPHLISGVVIKGRQVGRTLGIPTANLTLASGIIAPAFGVYATRVITGQGSFCAVTNVGVRPTLEDGRGITVEPWILDFEGDLYGETIRVEFCRHLRGERKFADLEELKGEILRNAEQTRTYFKAN